jgi:diguanylate cyclase (GGDEF)-like protein
LSSTPSEPSAAPGGEPSAEELRAALEEARRRIVELEELAHEDELTGVLNRRGFQQELRRAQSYCERYGVPVALALVDLDFFKAINDTHGHSGGDAVLRAVARFLSTHVRASDVVARIGGDEFALLLWHADASQAEGKLARLTAELSELQINHHDERLHVKASYGVAALAPSRSDQDVFERADKILYRAKAQRAPGNPPQRG